MAALLQGVVISKHDYQGFIMKSFYSAPWQPEDIISLAPLPAAFQEPLSDIALLCWLNCLCCKFPTGLMKMSWAALNV